MADREVPLRQFLQDGCDEADLQRVWRKLQHAPERRARGPRAAKWGMALAACLALCVFAWLLVRTPADPAGPLTRADGAAIAALAVEPDSPRASVPLDDGSRIELTPDTRVEVLENDGSAFRTVLRRGGGTFDVHPGGPRKWTVECGGIAVEVVGTRFTLERRDGWLQVRVEHGVVVVRGAHVPDRVLRLEAGQSARVATDDASAAAPSGSAEPAASCPSPETSAAPVQSATPAQSASLGAQDAIPTATASAAVRNDAVDAWLREADTARLDGDRSRAAELLRRVIQTAPKGDPRLALAAFSLAQLEMHDRPGVAAESLSSALDAGVPIGMQEDSWARLVQAYARTGDRERARQAAREYERRFPNGSRLAEVRRWADGRD